MSALQLNPGLLLRPDWEVPFKAVVDHLVNRNDVEADRLALNGYSLGPGLAARAAAYEKRIGTCICDGLVVNVYEEWKPFNVEELGCGIECPFLALYGEAEYAEQESEALIRSIGCFLGEPGCPAHIHEFTYEDGWAATHCQVGGSTVADAVIFDWLGKVVINKNFSAIPAKIPSEAISRHHKNPALPRDRHDIRIGAV
jgi:hypothetical protein